MYKIDIKYRGQNRVVNKKELLYIIKKATHNAILRKSGITMRKGGQSTTNDMLYIEGKRFRINVPKGMDALNVTKSQLRGLVKRAQDRAFSTIPSI